MRGWMLLERRVSRGGKGNRGKYFLVLCNLLDGSGLGYRSTNRFGEQLIVLTLVLLNSINLMMGNG